VLCGLAEPPEKEKQIAAPHSTALEMGLRSVGLTKARSPARRSIARSVMQVRIEVRQRVPPNIAACEVLEEPNHRALVAPF
jgi:hypothetical protein